MSDEAGARDLSDSVLRLVVRLLPSHRSEWGRAMCAELAALDDAGARRRHTLGCARAVLSDPTAVRTVTLNLLALAFGAVALAFAISMSGVGARIQTIAFVVVLGVLAWCGRRPGALGPTADHPSARRLRGMGYAVLGAYVLSALASFAGASPERDQSGVWALYLALTVYFTALLFVTAHRTAVRSRALGPMALVAAVGLAAWWVPMLLDASVRAHPTWAVLSVGATVTAGLIVATLRHWPYRRAAVGGLAAGVATCLLIFVLAQATYRLDARLVPDLGRVPGMTAAAEVEQNRAEAADPYVAELLVGAALSAVLLAATCASRVSPARRPSAADSPSG